jgi:hypothetical protein
MSGMAKIRISNYPTVTEMHDQGGGSMTQVFASASPEFVAGALTFLGRSL